jgi:hypothetical protein
MTEREQFEVWAKSVYGGLPVIWRCDEMFSAWQASRRAALEEAGTIAFDFVFDRANAVEARKLANAIRALADGGKA